MHSETGSGCVFMYNSDLSGDVLISMKDSPDVVVSVPGKDLIEFVVRRAIDALISRIEDLPAEKVWGWITGRRGS